VLMCVEQHLILADNMVCISSVHPSAVHWRAQPKNDEHPGSPRRGSQSAAGTVASEQLSGTNTNTVKRCALNPLQPVEHDASERVERDV